MPTGFKKDDLVEHASLGLGKVIAVELEYIHIYFLEDASRFAKELKWSTVERLLRLAESQSHPELDTLPLFVKDGRRYRLEKEVMTFDQAVARFREIFPKGFEDAAYRSKERDYKYEAHQALQDAFGGGKGSALLAAGQVREVIERALKIEGKTNLTNPKFEKPRMADAMKDEKAASGFFSALFQLIEAGEPTPKSFEALTRAASELPATGGRLSPWPTVTIFPALLVPEHHIFIRPMYTQEAASRLRHELNYKPDPNWLTYNSVLRLAKKLLDRLKPLGAIDNIDVQSFIYVTASAVDYGH